MSKRVFITVAEVSGDLHAAQLIRSLRRMAPDLIIEGIGGPAMAQAGAKLHRETVGGAAMTGAGRCGPWKSGTCSAGLGDTSRSFSRTCRSAWIRSR